MNELINLYANKHTRLMNKFIGLCAGAVGWPSPLGTIGYEVQLIEGVIILDSARRVVPDLIACSQTLDHAIVAECKSGSSLDIAQDKRYKEVTAANIASVVTVDNEDHLTHIVAYVVDSDKYSQLYGNTSFPFIVFGDDCVEGRGNFKLEKLNIALQKVEFHGTRLEPTKYYPFSHDDATGVIVSYAINAVMQCIKKDPKFKFDPSDEDSITVIIAVEIRF